MRNWFLNVLELFRKNRRGQNLIKYEFKNYESITLVGTPSFISIENSEEEIDEDFDDFESKKIQAQTLPDGWIWKEYDDSGCLLAPNGEEYFLYDIVTMEYQITVNHDYNLFLYSPFNLRFTNFKLYAEEYIKVNILQTPTYETNITKGEKYEI